MTFFRLLIFTFYATALFGCAKQYVQVSQSQSQMDIMRNSINESRSRANACLAKIGQNPDVQLVYKSIIFENLNSPNKIELMTVASKITEMQKKELLTYIPLLQNCREVGKENLIDYPSLISIISRSNGDMDIVFADLISKKITIGEANKRKSEILIKANDDFTAAAGNMANREKQAAQADAAQRRAIAAQFLMNQQNINAAQQMNSQNQIYNNRPVKTTCNQYGSQVNCTSY
jgi:hypothetical protein